MQWTVEDEVNLIKWVEEKGFRLCYMPEVEEWGYYHVSNAKEILGGFPNLASLKQHLASLKGVQRDVRIVSSENFERALKDAKFLSGLN